MSHYWSPTSAEAKVTITWQRLVDKADYLLTMHIGIAHSSFGGGLVGAAYPQAHAVVNDFGDLVITRGWQ